MTKMQKEFINITTHKNTTRPSPGYSELLATEPENGRMYVNPILQKSKNLEAF